MAIPGNLLTTVKEKAQPKGWAFYFMTLANLLLLICDRPGIYTYTLQPALIKKCGNALLGQNFYWNSIRTLERLKENYAPH